VSEAAEAARPEISWDPLSGVGASVAELARGRAVIARCVEELAPLIEGYGMYDEERFLEELDEAERARRRWVAEARELDEACAPRVVAAVMIITDLVGSGWVAEVYERTDEDTGAVAQEVALERREAPERDPSSHSAARKRFKKNQLVSARTSQLRAGPAQKFLAEMERPRAASAGGQPVTALFRDGDDLADELEEGRELLEVVSPYVQVIEEGATCEHTGLKLVDVFRYLRSTWAGPYNKPPGRSLLALVRDAAAPSHPVMGLIALSNAPIWHGARDQHIGWESEGFLREMIERDPAGLDRWLEQVTAAALSRLFLEDFIEEGVVTEADLEGPSDDALERLEAAAESAKAARAEEAPGREDEPLVDDGACERWARRPLFRAKRAEELAKLLRARRALRADTLEGDERLRAAVVAALGGPAADEEDSERAEEWVKRAKHIVSAARDMYGVGLGELSTCGAIAPYSSLIGGKLIAMLAASPEVLWAFEQRYADTANNIASKKAGRLIKSGGRLAYLTTSSLYDTRPTMYDRVGLTGPGGEALRFKFLQYSKGEGSFHLSVETHKAIKEAAGEKAKRVTSEFGEGTSARLRSLRDCLAELGLPSSEVLTHGQRRAAYGVALMERPRDYLLNLSLASAPEDDSVVDLTPSPAEVHPEQTERLAPDPSDSEAAVDQGSHDPPTLWGMASALARSGWRWLRSLLGDAPADALGEDQENVSDSSGELSAPAAPAPSSPQREERESESDVPDSAPPAPDATAAVVSEWAARWGAPRLADDSKRARLLDGLRQHDLCLPLTHGAKVRAPREDLEQPLFDFAD